jgi:hypothetical protein
MRIIHEIDRGRLKVSVFRMGEKTSVKFEKDLNELIIKFRDGSLEDEVLVNQFLTEDILVHYESLLDNASHTKIDRLIKLEEDKGIIFPEII